MLCLNTVSTAIPSKPCLLKVDFATIAVRFCCIFFFQLEFKVEKLVTDQYVAVKYLPHVLPVGLTIFINCFTIYKIVGFCDFFIQVILFHTVKHNSVDFIFQILYFMWRMQFIIRCFSNPMFPSFHPLQGKSNNLASEIL